MATGGVLGSQKALRLSRSCLVCRWRMQMRAPSGRETVLEGEELGPRPTGDGTGPKRRLGQWQRPVGGARPAPPPGADRGVGRGIKERCGSSRDALFCVPFLLSSSPTTTTRSTPRNALRRRIRSLIGPLTLILTLDWRAKPIPQRCTDAT